MKFEIIVPVVILGILGFLMWATISGINESEKEHLQRYQQCKDLVLLRNEVVIHGQTVAGLEWCFQQFKPILK